MDKVRASDPRRKEQKPFAPSYSQIDQNSPFKCQVQDSCKIPPRIGTSLPRFIVNKCFFDILGKYFFDILKSVEEVEEETLALSEHKAEVDFMSASDSIIKHHAPKSIRVTRRIVFDKQPHYDFGRVKHSVG
ncbi:hypothetical protein MKX07_006691 [Trichoderma sp. CBMAI-0711]|nr:hypothetical protein MKX07_006691 [Trichoderma sp. CBMAI-0711]